LLITPVRPIIFVIMSQVRDGPAGDRLAQALRSAASSPSEAAAAPERWLFCLRLLKARYAVDASLVGEVVRLSPLTRLPAAPSFLPGVFNHRGEIIPVLDIHQLVGQPGIPVTAATRVAIAACGEWKVALVAEALEGLICVDARKMEAAPASGGGVAEFLSGVARDGKGDIAVLDLNRMVESARARSVPT
jgi:purine-binding chemotaxis protein CheW